MTWLLRAGLALALTAPSAATAQTAPLPRPTRQTAVPTPGGPAVVPAATVQPCDATSIDSPPGKAWWAQEHWRYQTDAEAIAAYQALVNNGKGTSPWPTWYQPAPGLGTATPPLTLLPVGTRFQMALKPGQKKESPGAWGTFDYIADVQDVREFLAVIHLFKPEIDRVVTYEVTQMLPVLIGPVGPQVDTESCQYYPGRWSQFQMLPKWDEVMGYLKVIEVRTIQ
ncbi:MAG: hypothetical protein V4574_16900 [Pseudomonadota bacterium]